MGRNIETLIREFVSEKIEHLNTENKCCLHWFGPYRQLEHVLIQKLNFFGLRSRIHIINGFEVIKIYKPSCSHSIHQPSTLQLTKQSQKDILHHLKKTEYDVFQQEMYISPQIFRPLRQKPNLPPNRFTIGPVRQTIYQSVMIGEQIIYKSWRIYQFKEKILQTIKQNQVVVINGDVSLEKSTAIPMFIVDESTASKTYCKILCVEADNLSAITHSTVLTKYINERIGSRVGFQVYLQSRVCDNTNLIYTTAVFFLRVLMGQNPKDSFRHISHIVISDVHLHHAYTDILLYEIKNVLQYYPQIKIVLLSDSRENINLLSYFEKGEELRLQLDTNDVKVYFLEEINLIIGTNQDQLEPSHNVNHILPPVISKDNMCANWVDKALEEYAQTGSDSGLNRFLYFVNSENVSVNYIHSKFGYTALILAAKHGNAAHALRLLTCENADPYIQDHSKITALEYAISSNDATCARTLLKYVEANACEFKPPPIDFPVISKLIQLLTTNWKFGHILVFLPTYEDLLKLNYAILKLQFIGKIPQEISIYLLHSNMQYDELQPIISESQSVKIILATKVAESLTYLNDITYVIDSSQDCFDKYDLEHKCKVTTMEWASTESLLRRALVAGRKSLGHCFRLIPKNLIGKLSSVTPVELLYMPTNRIALTVKFLSPQKSVAEYLQNTIVQPPIENVRHSIEFLKQIEVFDCMEEVTWLGCRLVDVPMDLELGKALVLSILLKCLDPVLTIVSFLACTDSREMALCQAYHTTDCKQNKKEKHDSVSEESFSDHLTLLRLYQMWQNDKRENTVNDILSNERTFVVNGILDKVCGIRTYLVGALRSSQLIHNQGQLSMHSINSKANNWAVIKAALAGGLYPKLCMIDRLDVRLKSKAQELCIHPNSTLRTSKNTVLNPFCQRHPSNWIVFYGETNNGTVNTISNCTLINPATITLLAGKTEFDPENILFPKVVDLKSPPNMPEHAAIFIDEWIWLRTDIKSALLLFSLRQRFNMAYMDFLQTCGNSEKWRKNNTTASEIHRVFDLISKVLLDEDVSAGFVQPVRVGNRPKAMANKFTSDFDVGIHPLCRQRKVDVLTTPSIQNSFLNKEFFLVSLFDKHEIMKSFWKLPVIDISRDPFYASICSSASSQKMTYVIVCSLNRKRVTNVALVKLNDGSCYLRNSFQVNLPVYDVIIMCKAYKMNVPMLKSNKNPIKLDNNVGELILDLL